MAALFGRDLYWKQWRLRTNSYYQTVENDLEKKVQLCLRDFPHGLLNSEAQPICEM